MSPRPAPPLCPRGAARFSPLLCLHPHLPSRAAPVAAGPGRGGSRERRARAGSGRAGSARCGLGREAEGPQPRAPPALPGGLGAAPRRPALPRALRGLRAVAAPCPGGVPRQPHTAGAFGRLRALINLPCCLPLPSEVAEEKAAEPCR